jgi:hypothetical protein
MSFEIGVSAEDLNVLLNGHTEGGRPRPLAACETSTERCEEQISFGER